MWPSLPKDVSKVPDDVMAILKSGPRAEVQICPGGRGMGSPPNGGVVKSRGIPAQNGLIYFYHLIQVKI